MFYFGQLNHKSLLIDINVPSADDTDEEKRLMVELEENSF